MTWVNKKILITKDQKSGEIFCDQLKENFFQGVVCPCLKISFCVDEKKIEVVKKNLQKNNFTHVIFTSKNAAKYFYQLILQKNISLKIFEKIFFIAISTSTKNFVEKIFNRPVNFFLKKNASAKELTKQFNFTKENFVLLPGSNIAMPHLPNFFRDHKISFTTFSVYHVQKNSFQVPKNFADSFDAITFFSPSAVRNFLLNLQEQNMNLGDFFEKPTACIGNTTYEFAKSNGFKKNLVANETTSESMIDCLKKYFAEKKIV